MLVARISVSIQPSVANGSQDNKRAKKNRIINLKWFIRFDIIYMLRVLLLLKMAKPSMDGGTAHIYTVPWKCANVYRTLVYLCLHCAKAHCTSHSLSVLAQAYEFIFYLHLIEFKPRDWTVFASVNCKRSRSLHKDPNSCVHSD